MEQRNTNTQLRVVWKLVRRGVITPGERVLRIHVRGHTIYLDVNEKGRVCYGGLEFMSISAAALHAAKELGYVNFPKRVLYQYVTYKGGKTLKELGEILNTGEEPETPTLEGDTGCQMETTAWVPVDSDLPSWTAFSKPRGYKKLYEVVKIENPAWKGVAFEYGIEEDETLCMEEETTVNMCDPGELPMDYDHDSLDMDVKTNEVICRIETVCQFILDCLMEGTLPTMACEMSDSSAKKSFSMDSEKSLLRFSRMTLVLNKIHEILCDPHGKRITQRDLYYVAKVNDTSIKAPQMMELIQDVAQLLHVPRFALGLDCRSKGFVYGPLTIGSVDGTMRDCLKEARGSSVSGSTLEILEAKVSCSATCIIVLEKETVFQRLIAQSGRDFKLQSCLFVTACGYPDLATRVLLHKIGKKYPDIPMVGIFDWNPHGVQILCQFKYGSKKSVESQSFRLENLHWLGVRSSMIRSALSCHDCLEDLSLRDRAIMTSLKSNLQEHGNTAWIQEVQCMEYAGVKADIESLYSNQTIQEFCDTIQRMVITQEWI